MKKILMILVVFLAIYGLETQQAKAIKVTITVVTGSGSNCAGRGICSITIDISLRAMPSGGSSIETIDGMAEVQGDKMSVTLSKALSDMATNEKGVKSVSIKGTQRLSPDVAKQLGYSELAILPGDYVMNGNSFTFMVRGSKASGPAKGATKAAATGSN